MPDPERPAAFASLRIANVRKIPVKWPRLEPTWTEPRRWASRAGLTNATPTEFPPSDAESATRVAVYLHPINLRWGAEKLGTFCREVLDSCNVSLASRGFATIVPA